MTVRLSGRAGVLTTWLDPVDQIVDECKIRFEPGGPEISAVGPANVSMVEAELDKTALSGYSGEGEVLGIDLGQLLDVLSLADRETGVIIELDEETRRLAVDAAGLEYEFGVIDPDSIRSEPDLPDLDWPAEIVIEVGELATAITAAGLCADHIRIRGSGDLGYQLSATGDVDETELSLSPVEIERDGTADSLFSLAYLEEISGPMEETVRIQAGEEIPLDAEYRLLDGDCHVRNLVAPRVEG